MRDHNAIAVNKNTFYFHLRITHKIVEMSISNSDNSLYRKDTVFMLVIHWRFRTRLMLCWILLPLITLHRV